MDLRDFRDLMDREVGVLYEVGGIIIIKCFDLASVSSAVSAILDTGILFLRIVCRCVLIVVQPHSPLQDRIEAKWFPTSYV